MNVCYSTPPTYVAYTSPQCETVVRDQLKVMGFRPYMPIERSMKTVRRKRVEVEKPLFSRYLFVELQPMQDWSAILAVKGVEDVLRNNDVPSRVPSAWIDMLRKMEEAGSFDRRAGVQPFKIGESVRISDGPFAGLQAQIQSFVTKLTNVQAHRRAKLLLQFLGSIEVDVVALERV